MQDILRGVVEFLQNEFADAYLGLHSNNYVDFRYDGRCLLLLIREDGMLNIEHHVIGADVYGKVWSDNSRFADNVKFFDLADPESLGQILSWVRGL